MSYMVGSKVRDFERPIAQSVSEFRNQVSDIVRETAPELGEDRNIGNGRLIVLQSTMPLGFIFGGSVDIESSESVSDGTIYTVNVNGVSKNAAAAQAWLAAGNGFASILVDELSRENMEVVNERVLVDTYEVQVKVGE